MDLDYNPSYRSFIFNNKWVATVASIWIQTTSGYAYTFGVYSQSLKSSQHYDQSTLDTVAVFKDLGGNLGIFAGLLYSSVTNRPSSTAAADYSSSKSGPWVVVLGGAVLSFVGFFFMWMSVVGLLPRPPVPLMCFYMFLAAQGTTFFNTANVVTAVHNFSDYRGTSVGIMKVSQFTSPFMNLELVLLFMYEL